MNKILFRCSKLGALMTEPKLKTDKEAGLLSETAKTLVREKWLQDKYNYSEKIVTDEMLKGNMCEQDSMQLFQDFTGSNLLLKNNTNFNNDYITGTPDIIHGEFVSDLKTSWSLRTFMECEPTKDNIWQIKGYMALTGKTKGHIIYCLVPTPDEIILEQKKRVYYKFNCDEENPHYREMSEQIEHNNKVILTIPLKERVKIFEFEYSQDDIDKLYSQIEKARNYYNQITL